MPSRIPEALVERAARKIAIHQGVDPDQLGPGERHVADVDGIPTIISDHRGPLWRMWIPQAQIALAEVWPAIEALQILHEETADYIRINKLGDVHHNRSMRMSREALTALGLGVNGNG